MFDGPNKCLINLTKEQSMKTILTILVVILTQKLWAEDTIFVFGSQDKAFTTPGAARFISKDELQRFHYSDPVRMMQSVAGTHLQEEDGFGLRPNIGLRGATPQRSKKIALMEDGVPIAPAPYSAPAAYFFPNMMRADHLEVFKGTSSIKYGPHSIGGAINFVTREIPQAPRTELMASLGLVEQYRLSTARMEKPFGYLVEYNRAESDGFKQLPAGKPTGFRKNDLLLKGVYHFGRYRQNVSLKVSHASEKSHETYLGLTRREFENSPYARYAASAKDLMKWDQQQYQMRYAINPNANLKINAALYYHKFARNWYKFSGFGDGVHVSNYLDSDSGSFHPHFLNVLRGEADSSLRNGNDEVVIGSNDRKYYSRGILLQASLFRQTSANIHHDLLVGLRYHQDQVKRFQTKDRFKMYRGKLIPSTQGIPGNQDIDTTTAGTLFLEDVIDFSNGLTVSAGIRFENVDTTKKIFKSEIPLQKSHYQTLAPGVGVQYSPHQKINFIAGISQGVSAVSPGQKSNVKPEKSINYEAGVKYNGAVRGELIGFFNDYKNIKGFCTFSSGCEEQDLNREFNGGKAHIYGLEGRMDTEYRFSSFHIPIQFNYTQTIARFRQKYQSENREWGLGTIQKGDPLPYIPRDKLSFTVGLKRKAFSTFVTYNRQGLVYDQSVQKGRQTIPAHTVIDWSAHYRYSKRGTIFTGIDNLLANQYLVSLRPYGARPGRPRSFKLGMKYVF